MGMVMQDSICGLTVKVKNHSTRNWNLEHTSTERLRSLENAWEKGTSGAARAAATIAACCRPAAESLVSSWPWTIRRRFSLVSPCRTMVTIRAGAISGQRRISCLLLVALLSARHDGRAPATAVSLRETLAVANGSRWRAQSAFPPRQRRRAIRTQRPNRN